MQAFMRASRLPYPAQESYWATNVVHGVGLGTSSLIYGVARGIGGVVYEPYIGAKTDGFYGGVRGMLWGVGGLIGRPIKGAVDFIAQPIAGAINTPNFIYKKFTTKADPLSAKMTNFKIFGMDEA